MLINKEDIIKDLKLLSKENQELVHEFIKSIINKADKEKRTKQAERKSKQLTYNDLRISIRKWIDKIAQEECVQMYNSIGTYITNHRGKTLQENFENYMIRYEKERPFLIENKDKVQDIFLFIYTKRGII